MTLQSPFTRNIVMYRNARYSISSRVLNGIDPTICQGQAFHTLADQSAPSCNAVVNYIYWLSEWLMGLQFIFSRISLRVYFFKQFYICACFTCFYVCCCTIYFFKPCLLWAECTNQIQTRTKKVNTYPSRLRQLCGDTRPIWLEHEKLTVSPASNEDFVLE